MFRRICKVSIDDCRKIIARERISVFSEDVLSVTRHWPKPHIALGGGVMRSGMGGTMSSGLQAQLQLMSPRVESRSILSQWKYDQRVHASSKTSDKIGMIQIRFA